MIPCQVRGPQVPGGPGGAGAGQFGPAQVAGPMVPLQVTGAGAYLPAQNGGGDWSSMFNMMMPMIMMIMMMAIMMPMLKGFGKETA